MVARPHWISKMPPRNIESLIIAKRSLAAAEIAEMNGDIEVARAHMKVAIDASLKFWKSLKEEKMEEQT